MRFWASCRPLGSYRPNRSARRSRGRIVGQSETEAKLNRHAARFPIDSRGIIKCKARLARPGRVCGTHQKLCGKHRDSDVCHSIYALLLVRTGPLENANSPKMSAEADNFFRMHSYE